MASREEKRITHGSVMSQSTTDLNDLFSSWLSSTNQTTAGSTASVLCFHGNQECCLFKKLLSSWGGKVEVNGDPVTWNMQRCHDNRVQVKLQVSLRNQSQENVFYMLFFNLTAVSLDQVCLRIFISMKVSRAELKPPVKIKSHDWTVPNSWIHSFLSSLVVKKVYLVW